MIPSLSVALSCSNPISMDFPLKECIQSIVPIADEIIIVNGDKIEFDSYGEVHQVLNDYFQHIEKIMRIYHLPWRDSFRKNMSLLSKTAAISQCTKDYILLLDADEVIHEKDYERIKKCLEIGHDAYSFRTIHFYRDYDHYKVNGERWYNHRPKLFKNGLGIWDGYQSWISEWDEVIIREYTADLVTWDYEPVHEFSKQTKIDIFHYGYTRKPEIMLKKQNNIEKRHHPDWKELDKWIWDMSDTKEFKGAHPEVMEERIKEWEKII